MFAIPSAKLHFFFEICKRKIIFPQKSSISCLFQTSLEKEKRKRKEAKELVGVRVRGRRCRRRDMAAGQTGLIKGWESL